jgi:hypothetical protein
MTAADAAATILQQKSAVGSHGVLICSTTYNQHPSRLGRSVSHHMTFVSFDSGLNIARSTLHTAPSLKLKTTENTVHPSLARYKL